jgi:hemerythrin
MITWNEKRMATGEATIDAQHKELIRKIGQMQEAAKEGRGREEAMKVLDFLESYMVRHFMYEEGVMAQAKCPVAARNRKAHEEFIRTFQKLKAMAQAEGPSLVLFIEVQRFASGWLEMHICKVDHQLLDMNRT